MIGSNELLNNKATTGKLEEVKTSKRRFSNDH